MNDYNEMPGAESAPEDLPMVQVTPYQPQPAAPPVRVSDAGLGVPPFRPAMPSKEPPTMMGRPTLPTASGPAGQPMPARPVTVQAGRNHPRDPSERRTLVVGRGISVQGTVSDAERLVVEGTVEASMIHAAELSIAPGGVFKGEAEVEDAEIAGIFDGTLTVRGNLSIRSTGRVLGTARCRRLQVDEGGQISGRMEMLTDVARAELMHEADEALA